MEYIRNTTKIQISEPTVISLGKFDGFHRGHKVLMEIARSKKKEGLRVVMFTFDLPPQSVEMDTLTSVITTNQEKKQLFSQSGVDYLIEYPFTNQVKNMEPEAFIQMLVDSLSVKCIVVGTDFCFGRNRAGDYHTLKACGKQYGFEVIVEEKMRHKDQVISSTLIRKEILQGNLKEANFLLGYEYFIKGMVVMGRQIGRNLGIPTVNLAVPEEKLLPPFGVYISKILFHGECYFGISNLGKKPTIEGENPVGLETHIFDFSQDIYGQEIDVLFLEFLRPEQKFDSLSVLKEQMKKDLDTAKKYYANVTKSIDSVIHG